jgi:hypothetical protein
MFVDKFVSYCLPRRYVSMKSAANQIPETRRYVNECRTVDKFILYPLWSTMLPCPRIGVLNASICAYSVNIA